MLNTLLSLLVKVKETHIFDNMDNVFEYYKIYKQLDNYLHEEVIDFFTNEMYKDFSRYNQDNLTEIIELLKMSTIRKHLQTL